MGSPASRSFPPGDDDLTSGWLPVHRALLIELLRQCQIGCAAWKRLETIIRDIRENPPAPSQTMVNAQTECFGCIQAIFVCVGVVRSILWPHPSPEIRDPDKIRQADERGTYLRKQLGIGDRSPLKPSYLRNAVLHVDERIDDFYAEHRRDRIRDFSLVFDVPASWMPPAGVSVPRAYLHPNDVVIWFDERAELRPIALALCDLVARFPLPIMSVRRSDDGTTDSAKGALRPP